ICKEGWHTKCMPTTPEINHPCHPNHALKLLIDGAPAYTDGKCHFCRQDLKTVVYHCFTCNFTLDLRCGASPKQVTIDESKCHNHPLTIMARQVSFLCNVCGTRGERNPYVCTACSFMVHEDCMDRPHVININRHDHRISHTYSLCFGNMVCRVCRLGIDWVYGAYSCSKCPEFVVHSKCATSQEVWDGKELHGVPEEEEEEPMFKVIEENVINHQMHPSHNLRLTADGVVRDEGVRCQLCEGSVYSDKLYSCMECDYVLHETCAYLPHKKRHGLSRSRISLKKGPRDGEYFKCRACRQLSTGYRYEFLDYNKLELDMRYDTVDQLGYMKVLPYGSVLELDLRCAAVDWSCDHESHPHTLFLTNLAKDTCGACGNKKDYVLRCVDCKFNLCYKCATYPKKIKHRCDDHPLLLSFGDKEQHGKYWCTVCETEADPKEWFYECDKCGIVGHIRCVLGDFANVKPSVGVLCGNKSGVIRNNSVTRPHCHYCGICCLVPFIYRVSEHYFCSFDCLEPKSELMESLKAEAARKRRLEEEIMEKTEKVFTLKREYLRSRESREF
ncbi:hypothetical protein CARUB_v10011348mg, partial [Capsella rubella]